MYGRTVHLAFRVYGLLVQPLYGFAVHPVRVECTTFLIFGRTARTLPRSIQVVFGGLDGLPVQHSPAHIGDPPDCGADQATWTTDASATRSTCGGGHSSRSHISAKRRSIERGINTPEGS